MSNRGSNRRSSIANCKAHNPFMTEGAIREQICEVGARLRQANLVGGAEGNITARLDGDRLLSTPSGIPKECLDPRDMVVIDMEGNALGGGNPSTEIKMHLRIYEKRANCMAVVHAHPLTATAFSLAGQTISSAIMPEAAYVLGDVALVPYGTPGTEEVPDAIAPFLSDHKTFLLSHHGAVTLGKDLLDACYRMETLERIAEIVLRARMLGGEQPLSPAQLKVIKGWISGEM